MFFSLSLSLSLSVAHAAGSCPSPLVDANALDYDAAADGAAYVLAADEEVVCWWIVDEYHDTRLVHRWLVSDRYPTRIEALPDGRAVLVMSDLRLQVRHPGDKSYRNLDLYLPGMPALVLGHGRRDWLAVTVNRDEASALVMLVDIDRERTLASVALPRENLALSFADGSDAVWVDGAHALALDESGISVRGQSPR